MKFGLFDHVDANGRALAQQLDERIAFVAAAEKAGFYSYHVAEHHATPLNLPARVRLAPSGLERWSTVRGGSG